MYNYPVLQRDSGSPWLGVDFYFGAWNASASLMGQRKSMCIFVPRTARWLNGL